MIDNYYNQEGNLYLYNHVNITHRHPNVTHLIDIILMLLRILTASLSIYDNKNYNNNHHLYSPSSS